MSFALVFSGQGNQYGQMLTWLEDDELLLSLQEQLKVRDWRAAMDDPAWTRDNRNAQVLITATALSAWRQIAEDLPEPVGVAGYSVGELAAYCAAGVVDPKQAIALASARARLMNEAGGEVPAGLVAVTGLRRDDVARLLSGTPLHVAIVNGNDRVVVGGPAAALDELEAAMASRGARCTRIAVTVASHTPCMAQAADEFASLLEGVRLNPPSFPLFSNVADRVWSSEAARKALSQQICRTVRWDECMDQLALRAPRCVLEVGGGQALAQLWNQRHDGIPARSCDEFKTKSGLLAWLSRQLQA